MEEKPVALKPPEAPPAVKELKKSVLPPTQPLEPPEEEVYTIHVPEGITVKDLDIMKLTAQFVARNGKSFLTGLATREQGNALFNFLKPNHSLFKFFTRMCDAYSKVLMPSKDTVAKLKRDNESRMPALNRALRRLEYERIQDKEAREKEEAEEAERVAMLSTDWHDFVIVETIDFEAGDEVGLPQPITFRDAMRLARDVQFQEAEERDKKPAMDEEEAALIAQAQEEGSMGSRPGVEIQVAEDEELGAIPIVKDYKRQEAKQSVAEYDPTKFVISPITGELVPLEEMAEHMRVSLIDPRWRTQKEAMMTKIKETSKASDDEIGRNLSLLARTRPDVFASGTEAIGSAVERQMQENKANVPGPPNALQSTQATAAPGPPPPSVPPPAVPPPSVPPPSIPPPAVPPPAFPPTVPPPTVPPPSIPPPAVPPPSMPPNGPPPPQEPYAVEDSDLKRPNEEESEQEAKRQKLGTSIVLIPEDEFAASHHGPVLVRVICPDVPNNDALNGQVLEVTMKSIHERIQGLKENLAAELKIGVNKIRLGRQKIGLLMDAMTLAHYNIDSETEVQLTLKGRGGKKK